MVGAIRASAAALYDLFLPRICSVCGALLGPLDDTVCTACRSTFRPVGPVVCPTCGRPAERALAKRCRRCPAEPVYFASARAAFLYRDDLAEAVRLFKYNRRFELGRMLARAMFMTIQNDDPDAVRPDMIVPVPMHFLRRLHRGYNHAALLAEEYARLAAIPYSPDILARIRHTRRQTLLPPERRATNVLGAFEVLCPERVQGLRMRLVDDVFTSGHTVNECARTLSAAGAASVHVLALSCA